MEFDKSRVYTAVNADELKIGSKCIFANSIKEIKESLQTYFFNIAALTEIRDEGYCTRFITHSTSLNQDMDYPLAYLIEAPKEPQYKPFSTLEKAMEAIQKHGGWVKHKCLSFLVTAYDTQFPDRSVYFSNCWYSLQELYSFFTFDDGTPCGELAD